MLKEKIFHKENKTDNHLETAISCESSWRDSRTELHSAQNKGVTFKYCKCGENWLYKSFAYDSLMFGDAQVASVIVVIGTIVLSTTLIDVFNSLRFDLKRRILLLVLK